MTQATAATYNDLIERLSVAGFVIVPREATDKMLDGYAHRRALWREMISLAPESGPSCQPYNPIQHGSE